MDLQTYLARSYTAYQATEHAEAMLRENGFEALRENESWHIVVNGKYYVERGGSSLIAFRVGSRPYFKIVSSHTDSPAIKLKENAEMQSGIYVKWNTERYGGGIWYSFFDRPLRVAGQVVCETEDGVEAHNAVSSYVVTIPSLAVHMNRTVNDGFAVNPQNDLLPLVGLKGKSVAESLGYPNAIAYDLFLAPDELPFMSGINGEFLCSPRLDNLTSAYSSLAALCEGEGEGICVAALFDHEEVGSRTRQGAGSDFLVSVLGRVCAALQIDAEKTYAGSFAISLDNAHAVHPNHPEKCDPTNRPVIGGGVVIKAHANKAYTTEALSAAVIRSIFKKAGVLCQTFYNRSDMASGSTLGAISLSQVGMLTVDMGLAQLAMHSAVECVAKSDLDALQKGLVAFYSADFELGENSVAFRESK